MGVWLCGSIFWLLCLVGSSVNLRWFKDANHSKLENHTLEHGGHCLYNLDFIISSSSSAEVREYSMVHSLPHHTILCPFLITNLCLSIRKIKNTYELIAYHQRINNNTSCMIGKTEQAEGFLPFAGQTYIL